MQTSRPIRSRRFIAGVLVAVVGLVATGCADDGELGGPQLGGSLAASVGTVDLTAADLETEVELWASNPTAVQQAFGVTDVGAPGRRNSQMVAAVLSFRILFEQASQLAESQGVPVSSDQVDQVAQQMDASFVDPATGEPLLGKYSGDFRRYIFTALAYQSSLGQMLAAGEPPAVSVNPRYGDAVDAGQGIVQVQPPSGPLADPSAGLTPAPPSP